MASARNAAALPPLPPHLRACRIGDILPWSVPRSPSPFIARQAPELPPPASKSAADPTAPADGETLDTLYRDETPWLLRFFRRRLGSVEEADDLAHETMARYIKASLSASIATPQAYLRRIATNLLRDRTERGSTRLSLVSAPIVEGLDAPADDDQHRALEAREELGYWEAVLRRLPARTLEIFLLSRVDGFTYKEIADHLDTSVWSVKRHMVKAIAYIDQNRSGTP